MADYGPEFDTPIVLLFTPEMAQQYQDVADQYHLEFEDLLWVVLAVGLQHHDEIQPFIQQLRTEPTDMG